MAPSVDEVVGPAWDDREQRPYPSNIEHYEHRSEAYNAKPTYKSYKKKYRKLRHAFDQTMATSNAHFINEQNATRIAQRLQEQNDQLLEMLLEVNDSRRLVPPFLCYDLRSPPPSISDLPDLEPDLSPRGIPDFETIKATLEEAENDLQRGEIGLADYEEMRDKLLEELQTSTKLSSLALNIPHTEVERLAPGDFPHDLNSPTPAGFLDPVHEEEYLTAMDAALDTLDPHHPVPVVAYPARLNERQEKERDAALRNPVSVYNWLRRHVPSVFLQDNPDEKPTTSSRNSKRANNNNHNIKQEPELLDDEGNLLSGIVDGPVKVKRKREDEPYRPKGGSSRPTKRRKAVSGPAEEKTKPSKSSGA